MREKPFYLRPAQAGGMALAVKVNEPANPMQICLLRPQAVVLDAQALAVLVKQLWLRHADLPGLVLYKRTVRAAVDAA